jgi:hypothetical protein
MMAPDGWMTHEHFPHNEAEAKSLDIVQRVVLSVLLAFVFGALAAVLAVYLVVRGEQDLPHNDVVGLWVMSGVVGIVTAAAILVINRRKLYNPLVLLGLLPMAASWYWIFH